MLLGGAWSARDSASASRSGGEAVWPVASSLSLPGLHPSGWRTSQASGLRARPTHRLLGLVFGSAASGWSGSVCRLVPDRAPPEPSSNRLPHPLPDPALGEGAASGQPPVGQDNAPALGRLAMALSPPDLPGGNIRGYRAFCRHLLPRC